MERYCDWFGVRFEFLLYDVTGTFFEGQATANEKAARGYSRDSRPDCKQVCIGPVCTPEGLPLSFEVFAGNRADVTTVEEIVESDLGLRPIYHQKTQRVEAHILVCFLALALWHTLEMWMSAKHLGTSARKLLAEMATIKSMDVLLPIQRAETRTELRLRVVAKPEPHVAQLLAHLGLHLHTRGKIVENVVEKIAP